MLEIRPIIPEVKSTKWTKLDFWRIHLLTGGGLINERDNYERATSVGTSFQTGRLIFVGSYMRAFSPTHDQLLERRIVRYINWQNRYDEA